MRLLSFTAETFQIIVFLPNFPVENVVVSVSCQTVRPVSGVRQSHQPELGALLGVLLDSTLYRQRESSLV